MVSPLPGNHSLRVLAGDPRKKSRNDDRTEFFFIYALSGTVPTTSDTWLIDSGASNFLDSSYNMQNTPVGLAVR